MVLPCEARGEPCPSHRVVSVRRREPCQVLLDTDLEQLQETMDAIRAAEQSGLYVPWDATGLTDAGPASRETRLTVFLR